MFTELWLRNSVLLAKIVTFPVSNTKMLFQYAHVTCPVHKGSKAITHLDSLTLIYIFPFMGL